MEKYDTFCDGADPSPLSVLEDAPVLKTEANGGPSTCQSLRSVPQPINQGTYQDTNSSSPQQPTAPSSPSQTEINTSRATETSPLYNHRRIPHTDPETTRNLWEKVMAHLTSKTALLPSSNNESSTGVPSFRWSMLQSYGCEIKEGVTEASTTHFKNIMDETDVTNNPANSALLINGDEEFWKNTARTFKHLFSTEAGNRAYFFYITTYFLKEIEPFDGLAADPDQHKAWEIARLIEYEFCDLHNRGIHHVGMRLLPCIHSGNPVSQSATAPSQSSGSTQPPRGKSISSAGKSSSSAIDASHKSENAKLTLEDVRKIRPTIVYWLQRQKIPLRHWHMISSHTYESNLHLLAPYFTIMMVDDPGTGPNNSESKVLDNLFKIGSIAVYNRYLLKEKSIKRQSTSLDSKVFDKDLRHYGLTFDKVNFRLWCFKAKVDLTPTDDSKHKAKADPKPTGDSKHSARIPSGPATATSGNNQNVPCRWKGCEVTEILRGDLKERGHIDNIAGYIDKIQQYGSSVHGPGLEADLGRCFTDVPVGRPSLARDK
ncbi:MAG: hypothetical protein Q9187_003471 [Circinaria calcarea]